MRPWRWPDTAARTPPRGLGARLALQWKRLDGRFLPFADEIAFPVTPATRALATALVAHGAVTSDDGTHRFGPRADFPLSQFYTHAEQHGLSPRLFTHGRPTLEELFLHLTGRTLRE